MTIVTSNAGADIVSSTYWDSPHARAGYRSGSWSTPNRRGGR